ncbi:helix-turn-helix domain-containing protein [Sphingobacterium haloxyli]|uniref:Helix-turn-helix domain-containing protein n=1 Tax=Sphingobacterium haloxyli TaxID=2100533 RepID=A0A2S9IYD3_9SPHI|nr:helix-turn-helix domain-containing protein [Sphingobacterium haloxyli]PRD45539.1 hypothetical protein C5745_17655 [Sphingobacterium haloxyli]
MRRTLMAICRYLIRIIRLLHELKFQITHQETENRRVLCALRDEYADLKQQLSSQVEQETIYRDAEYAMEFIGISESTLARHQRKGQLAVAKIDRGKRYFRQQDLERFKREYWNLPD